MVPVCLLLCLLLFCVFLLPLLRPRYVWFLRSADGTPSYSATGGSKNTPPTQGWVMCKSDDDDADGAAKRDPAPKVELGDVGKGSTEATKATFVTVQGAGNPAFNGTYERPAEPVEPDQEGRDTPPRWAKQAGFGEYLSMGTNEDEPRGDATDSTTGDVRSAENPLYADRDAEDTSVNTIGAPAVTNDDETVGFAGATAAAATSPAATEDGETFGFAGPAAAAAVTEAPEAPPAATAAPEPPAASPAATDDGETFGFAGAGGATGATTSTDEVPAGFGLNTDTEGYIDVET